MNTEDIWNVALAALGSIGVGASIVVALSSWLGKIWANRIAEEDRSKFQKEIEGEIAKLKRHTDKSVQVHRIQFETEFKSYQDLWHKLCDAEDAAKALRPTFDFIPEKKSKEEIKESRSKAFVVAYQPFFDAVRRARPFVAASIEHQLTEMVTFLHHEYVDYQHDASEGRSSTDYWKNQIENWDKILTQSQSIRDAIRTRIELIEVAD